MQERIPAIFILALVIGSILSLSACSSGGSSSSTATVTSITISPTAVSVQINTTAEFTATVNLSNTTTATTSTAVTWLVNGVAGGTAATGTIVADSADVQVGIYTAPSIVPSTNNGQVNITATAPQSPGSGTTTTTTSTTITSNTAVVTIGIGQGLAVTPLATIVPAGAHAQFTATLNGLTDGNAIWSVSSSNGGNLGTIDTHSGLYTAPSFPPPGQFITITATDGTATATATAQVVYSALSLSGPFAFSYAGNDASGFSAAAGRFVADGAGHITSGLEDIESFLSGVTTQVPFSGTYAVGTDGRTTASITSSRGTTTWKFVMTTNQHALMIRFDNNVTGSGTIDQQNANALSTTNPNTILTGPYVFSASGLDPQFKPEALAGRFTADGAGNIPQTATILDVNNGGVVTTSDNTLHGTYAFDTANPGTGRGTLTLTSGTTNQLQYAFYLVDNTHLRIVETDSNAFLAGDVFSGASGAFSAASLASGNYVFTSSGSSNTGAFAAGGVFTSGGSGNVSAGALDTNNAGTVATNASLGTCAYTVDSTTGRIDLKLFAGTGACPATPSASIKQFAAYQTSAGPAVMIELDAAAVSKGVAFPQSTVTAASSGMFALALNGAGLFHNNSAAYQPDAIGQVTLSGTGISAGFLDYNNFNSVFPSDPISTTGSSISAAGTNGRGTAVVAGTNPAVTYNLVYYLVDANTALFFDQDTTRVATGIFPRQF